MASQETSDGQMLSLFMQELSGKFDSLRQEVDSLKKQQQKESSPARSSWTTSETDSSSSGDEQDERHGRDKGKRKASRSRANLSRSRHRSRSRRGERHTRSRSRSGTNRRSLTWGERMDHPENEVMDYTEDINFHDSGDEEVDRNPTGEDQKLCEVSEKTRVLLVQACSKRAPNSIRRKVRCPYPLPKVPATRTPQLDAFLKTEVSGGIKTADKELAKIQTFALDAIAPLTAILEADAKDKDWTREQLIGATKAAVQLIGNTSAKIFSPQKGESC